MTLDFIPFQSGLVLYFDGVCLVEYDTKITIFKRYYEFIVTFYFGGNGFDWCTTHEKGMSP